MQNTFIVWVKFCTIKVYIYFFFQQPGRLKLSSTGVMFKNIKTGILDQFSSSDIEEVHWLVRARGHCLKFILNSGNIHRFDGLKETVSDQYVCCYDKGGKVSGVFIVPKKAKRNRFFVRFWCLQPQQWAHLSFVTS